jgi:AsmA protein
MPVDELAALLPALNIALPNGASLQGGTASVELASEGALDRLVSEGTLSVDKTTLKNFDLGAKLRVLERLAGVQPGRDTVVDVLSSQVRSAPDGTTMNQISLVVPSIGTLTGDGTMSPAQALNFRLSASLTATGSTRVPLTVTGTASDPVFRVDAKALAGQTLKDISKDPNGAVDAAKGILNLFKRKQ